MRIPPVVVIRLLVLDAEVHGILFAESEMVRNSGYRPQTDEPFFRSHSLKESL